jgi:predicted MFS family arabinose efflux permease
VTSAVLLSALIVASLDLPLRAGTTSAPQQAGERRGFPGRFWMFAAFAVLYGICETLNGNWSQLDMTSELGASTTEAALALTAFWAMLTVGRIVFAAVERWVPERVTYNVLPFGLAGTFALIALLSNGSPGLGVLLFGLAGLGCSALLPLTIGFAQEELATIAAAAAGGIIAFYQLGYGIAAFGVGPLLDAGVTLPAVYTAAAGIAVAMGLLSFRVTRREHPR